MGNLLKSIIFKTQKGSFVLFSVFSFILGIFFIWILANLFPQYFFGLPQSSRALRLNQKDYPLINPLLLCNIDGQNSAKDKDLESAIKKFIDDRASKGLLENMSVYVANYGSGTWAGVN